MDFHDEAIQKLDPKTLQGLADAISCLCGEHVDLNCKKPDEAGKDCLSCQECMNWSVISNHLSKSSLSVEDLNDILLLANQFPISSAFFDFFFKRGKTEITFPQLIEGIIRFEGYAVLRSGNVRFAYRELYNASHESLMNLLGPLASTEASLKSKFGDRKPANALPTEISTDHTWLLGYIAKSVSDRDLSTYLALTVLLKKKAEGDALMALNKEQAKLYHARKEWIQQQDGWQKRFPNIDELEEKSAKLRKDLIESRTRGFLNTSHYLASDLMDVYVATSMREKWEFEEVNKVIATVFGARGLKKLNLRYFDPTQSFLENRVDKGLVEALMLKRCRCTVYMVQETDTLGKDSELATTLAQGKPVIAYVPEIDVSKRANEAFSRPLNYLQKRLSQLTSEERITGAAAKDAYQFLTKICDFQPYFRILSEEEQEYLEREKLTAIKKKMCEILAEGEKRLFSSRAETLMERHPLGIQVELRSGVANGVLVVRTEKDCADLVASLLTNSAEFSFDREKEIGITSLIEKISKSPFRVVTRNRTITNAFWSRYLSVSE